MRRAWGSSQEESPEGNPLTGEVAGASDLRGGVTSAGWGRSRPLVDVLRDSKGPAHEQD